MIIGRLARDSFRYLHGIVGYGFHFKPIKGLFLEGFANVDWASSLDDWRSTVGYYVYLGGNLIQRTWKKQKVVFCLSTKLEYKLLAQDTIEILWLQSLFHELEIKIVGCPILWCNSIGVGSLAFNLVFHFRTKHIKIDVHFICEKVLAKELDVRYISTEEQIPDVLTKPLLEARFDQLQNKLTVTLFPFNFRGSDRIS